MEWVTCAIPRAGVGHGPGARGNAGGTHNAACFSRVRWEEGDLSLGPSLRRETLR